MPPVPFTMQQQTEKFHGASRARIARAGHLIQLLQLIIVQPD
jgi:hypothetical protein